eukprot:scaffold12976_cov141-Cylindrotheca_fusiformis.AAC.1
MYYYYSHCNSVETMNALERDEHIAQVHETIRETVKAMEAIMENTWKTTNGPLRQYMLEFLSRTLIVPPPSPEEREQQERYKNQHLLFGLRMSPLAFAWQPLSIEIEALRDKIWAPFPLEKRPIAWHDFVMTCSSGSLPVAQYTDDMTE